MKFFGFSIERERDEPKQPQSLPQDQNLDGAFELSSGFSGFVGHGINFNDVPQEDEIQLVTKYREVANLPEIEKAINDIINECFAYDEKGYPVSINLDDVPEGILADNIREEIREEFNNILDMLNFKNDSYEIFRRWYVDGRLYYQKVIDEKDTKRGLVEIQYVDPRKIKKIRQELPNKDGNQPRALDGVDVNKKYIEYFLYNPMGIQLENPTGLRISPDSIVYVHSGILDKTNKVVLSFLHKAIRPLNMLNMVENALVIYRLARAPERRVFNVEMGKLPNQKAEERLNNLKNGHRRKLMFDSTTGEVKDDKRYMTMLEDFWFPQRDGKGTKVETLAGGQNLNQLDDVDYMRKKLIEALHVPISRWDPQTGFSLGRSNEITRDELAFTKFVARLRKRFSLLFDDLIGTHLCLKGIVTPEEWENIKGDISYDYLQDNFFSELKWDDVWANRMATYNVSLPAIENQLISEQFVREKILHIDEEEWEEIQEQLENEREKREAKEAQQREDQMMMAMMQQPPGPGPGMGPPGVGGPPGIGGPPQQQALPAPDDGGPPPDDERDLSAKPSKKSIKRKKQAATNEEIIQHLMEQLNGE